MTAIQRSSVPGFAEFDNDHLLATVAALGLDGCLFASPLEISKALDRSEMRDVAAAGRARGVSIGSSLGRLNPYRPDSSAPYAAVGDGDLMAGLTRVISACAEFGMPNLYFMAGVVEDRFNRTVAWEDQLVAIVAMLRRLAPVLRDHDMQFLLKTHEEITTFEVARLVETVGPDVLGVALDPVNLLVRIEDPVEATKRVAPFVKQVHLDDAIVRFTDEGIRRVLCPLGEGQIDWPTILKLTARAPRVIEMHKGQFAMPIYDPTWLAAQPDLTIVELAAVAAMAAEDPTRPIPWDQSDALARLEPALARRAEFAA